MYHRPKLSQRPEALPEALHKALSEAQSSARSSAKAPSELYQNSTPSSIETLYGALSKLCISYNIYYNTFPHLFFHVARSQHIPSRGNYFRVFGYLQVYTFSYNHFMTGYVVGPKSPSDHRINFLTKKVIDMDDQWESSRGPKLKTPMPTYKPTQFALQIQLLTQPIQAHFATRVVRSKSYFVREITNNQDVSPAPPELDNLLGESTTGIADDGSRNVSRTEQQATNKSMAAA